MMTPVSSQAENTLTLVLNGETVTAPRRPGKTLLSWLRDDCALTGTKEGCAQGECGACTVLVNGEAVNSCLMYLDALDGAEILTIEGLGKDGLDPVQKAFIACGAIQCGFCTPGMIMTVKGLLLKNPHPTEDEIRHAISGNLCRCTGYKKIVEAVKTACGLGAVPDGRRRGAFFEVGKNSARTDTEDKARGTALYAADLRIPGMLEAKAKRSPYAHARILAVRTEAARAFPGVAAVLLAEDIPGRKYFGQVYQDAPVICSERVRMAGDPVAVVVACDLETAERALDLIEVDYEQLPVIGSIDEALAPGAFPIHEDGNIRQVFCVKKGHAEEELASCAAVCERTFTTALDEHAYLETECSVAFLDPDTGQMTVCSPTQEVFSDRRQVAASLALPEEEVRIIQTTTGGAFGGKIDISTEIIAALASQKTGRPVRYRWDRRESMAVSTKRHPFRIHMKMGADQDGTLRALAAEVLVDNGAYTSMGAKVVQKSCLNLTGPYRFDNVSVSSKLIYTNRPHGGAMRGFGIPQAAFACEGCMDELAEMLGLDPVRFRLQNATRIGDATAGGEILRSAGAALCLTEAEKWVRKRKQAVSSAPAAKTQDCTRRGFGVSSFVYPVGLGFGTKDTSTAEVTLFPDGHVLVRTGAADLGQGSDSVMARICAEVLGTEEGFVSVLSSDTGNGLFGGLSSGSRQTVVTGRAVYGAAQKIRERLANTAADLLSCRADQITFRGRTVYPDGTEGSVSYDEVIRRTVDGRDMLQEHFTADITTEPVPLDTGQGSPFSDFVYGAQAAEVEVDTETGAITVTHLYAVHDVGCVIHPVALEGQIEGALSMGYGQAVMEEVLTENGKLLTPSFAEYAIPTSVDMPRTDFFPIETPGEDGPFGARGVAEPPVVGSAPAICSAVYDAVGVRVNELPVTAERLKSLLDAQKEQRRKKQKTRREFAEQEAVS